VSITNTTSFDAIGNPSPAGLYDIAMGPSSRNEICSSCMNNKDNCAGHFGHVELAMPVFNPFFIKTLHKIFTISCLTCFRIQLPGN
jgi:DNA-directed RNA polymerase I subunit RPA1